MRKIDKMDKLLNLKRFSLISEDQRQLIILCYKKDLNYNDLNYVLQIENIGEIFKTIKDTKSIFGYNKNKIKISREDSLNMLKYMFKKRYIDFSRYKTVRSIIEHNITINDIELIKRCENDTTNNK